MLPYFKGYTIAICAIAVGIPVVVSILWPLFTGAMMASTFGGLVTMFSLFVIGMLLGFGIFNKRADAKVQAMLDAYNDQCDPQALIAQGAQIASQVTYPCNQATSWFMGYYGQALLDAGDVQGAKNALSGIRISIDSSKKPHEKAGILVNYLPLCEKMEGSEKAIETIDEGLEYCRQASASSTSAYLDFLESQKKILEEIDSDDKALAISVCEKIVQNSDYPMRLRVEYAWTEASKLYGGSDESREIDCLRFIIDHGNKLALVSGARSRLDKIVQKSSGIE